MTDDRGFETEFPDPADAERFGVAPYDAQFPDWDAPAIRRMMTVAPFRKLSPEESDDGR